MRRGKLKMKVKTKGLKILRSPMWFMITLRTIDHLMVITRISVKTSRIRLMMKLSKYKWNIRE